jgi:hypothetical protein
MFSIEKLADGALAEKIRDALAAVIENIADPNTNYKTKRKLNISLSFIPDEKRELAEVAMEVKPTLAPTMPAKTRVFIDKDRSGKVVCAEYRHGIPGQMAMITDDAGAVKIEDPITTGLKAVK